MNQNNEILSDKTVLCQSRKVYTPKTQQTSKLFVTDLADCVPFIVDCVPFVVDCVGLVTALADSVPVVAALGDRMFCSMLCITCESLSRQSILFVKDCVPLLMALPEDCTIFSRLCSPSGGPIRLCTFCDIGPC